MFNTPPATIHTAPIIVSLPEKISDVTKFCQTHPRHCDVDKRTLVIPDIHQDTEYCKAVIEAEKAELIVFLGDVIDTHQTFPTVGSTKQTAIFYKGLINGEFGPSVVLAGNHDLGYRESWTKNQAYGKKIPLYHGCRGFSNNKSIEFNKIVSQKDWEKVNLFHFVNGWMLSHAGINPAFFNCHISIEDNIRDWRDISAFALSHLGYRSEPFLGVGVARRGDQQYGGITWQDWEREFSPIPIPQIVGHSRVDKTVRRNGNSFCIDGGQTTYAVIEPDGQLILKNTIDKDTGSMRSFWCQDDTKL